MIKEALQYVIGLGNTRTEEIGEQIYSTQQLHLIREATAETINVRSLSGIVEYVKTNFDLLGSLLIHVSSPTEVYAYSTFNRDFERNLYIKAEAMLPKFQFDQWYDAENFNIKLQSAFVKFGDKEVMLKVVGNIKEDAVKTVGDDGVSQAVVAKTGVATVDNVMVPNPVLLKPYRTFVEVDQPESDFIFRMQSGPRCALFEADGGAWKLDAMKSIQEYLQKNLAEQIEVGQVVIIA